MGKLDGINIHHTDQYHKKNEDIDMKNKRIDNVKTTTDNTNNLKYAINMECLLLQLSETLFWEYYQRASAFYHFPTSNSHELTFDAITRKVSQIYDQSLSQDNSYQNTTNSQPTICTNSDRINKRYYIQFNGSQRMISNIDLNPATNEEDIVNVFILYYISSFNGSYWLRASLMGHDDSNFDKFVSFLPGSDIVVSGTVGDYIQIGPNSSTKYKSKGNASELNKWVCLSIHWNTENETSYVYINGKETTQFKIRRSVGSVQLTFGDLNLHGIAPLHGKITTFLLYKNRRMQTRDILLHHHVLCKWFNIDHDPITF